MIHGLLPILGGILIVMICIISAHMLAGRWDDNKALRDHRRLVKKRQKNDFQRWRDE